MITLIPAQYRLLAAGLAAAVLLGLAAAGAWSWQSNAYGRELADLRSAHATQLLLIAQASERAIRDQADARLLLENKLQLLDEQRYGELRNAQANTDRLSAELAAATRRLSVRTAPGSATGVPAAPGSASVDDGAERIDIHPATAAGIVRVAGEADQCAVKLTALQEWARAVTATAAD